ncbi:MAG: hypothetical protein K8U57_22890 [Planctomycetes bacterium]|nr:hypothetical protein [Planctomycetota bacterium]
MTELRLNSTRVGDAGLEHFKDSKTLTLLSLNGTKVTDAGLAHLKDCKNLTSLGLRGTKVTADAVAEFAKTLPQCKIEWDGDVIDPKAK